MCAQYKMLIDRSECANRIRQDVEKGLRIPFILKETASEKK